MVLYGEARGVHREFASAKSCAELQRLDGRRSMALSASKMVEQVQHIGNGGDGSTLIAQDVYGFLPHEGSILYGGCRTIHSIIDGSIMNPGGTCSSRRVLDSHWGITSSMFLVAWSPRSPRGLVALDNRKWNTVCIDASSCTCSSTCTNQGSRIMICPPAPRQFAISRYRTVYSRRACATP